MTTSQPRLSRLSLWDYHVAVVLDVLRDALILLAQQGTVGGEPELNRAFYECILRANRMRFEAGLSTLDVPIMWESRNQPSPSTMDGTAERKIPDFQCGYIDHECPDPLMSSKSFVIECKRLGQATRHGWVFNERYVSDGVMRFIDTGWRYGKDVGSGAMIGYLDGTPLMNVLSDVNAAAGASSVPKLTHRASSAPIHELVHILDRGFDESPFGLNHLWVETPGPTPMPPKRLARKSGRRRPPPPPSTASSAPKAGTS